MTLPRNVVQKQDRFYFRRRSSGRETYTRLPDVHDASFMHAVEVARRGGRRDRHQPLSFDRVRDWTDRRHRYAPGEQIPRSLLTAAREARKRAKRKKLLFELTPEQLMVLWQRCRGACEVSGIPFEDETHGFRWPPFAISLDRIKCGEGYHFANTRLVCVAVNAALNQWGDAVFWRIVQSVNEYQGGTFAQKRWDANGSQ